MGMHRRLVVVFNGTWNEPEDWTNAARMKETIDTGPVENGVEQEVKYFSGVGTAWFGKLFGATMGFGLSEIIKDAFLWLSQRYIHGDEVFVFGFSRGAYSARSLVSLMHKCHGVLKPSLCSDTHVEHAYALSRDENVQIHDSKMKDFASTMCRPLRVKMIDVWDTVGALGIPETTFQSKTTFKPIMRVLSYSGLDRQHYQFHSQGLRASSTRNTGADAMAQHELVRE